MSAGLEIEPTDLLLVEVVPSTVIFTDDEVLSHWTRCHVAVVHVRARRGRRWCPRSR